MNKGVVAVLLHTQVCDVVHQRHDPVVAFFGIVCEKLVHLVMEIVMVVVVVVLAAAAAAAAAEVVVVVVVAG